MNWSLFSFKLHPLTEYCSHAYYLVQQEWLYAIVTDALRTFIKKNFSHSEILI